MLSVFGKGRYVGVQIELYLSWKMKWIKSHYML